MGRGASGIVALRRSHRDRQLEVPAVTIGDHLEDDKDIRGERRGEVLASLRMRGDGHFPNDAMQCRDPGLGPVDRLAEKRAAQEYHATESSNGRGRRRLVKPSRNRCGVRNGRETVDLSPRLVTALTIFKRHSKPPHSLPGGTRLRRGSSRRGLYPAAAIPRWEGLPERSPPGRVAAGVHALLPAAHVCLAPDRSTRAPDLHRRAARARKRQYDADVLGSTSLPNGDRRTWTRWRACARRRPFWRRSSCTQITRPFARRGAPRETPMAPFLAPEANRAPRCSGSARFVLVGRQGLEPWTR